MPISLLSPGRTPRIAWKYSARAMIWRILPTADGFCIGEERDPVSREATFFCVDAGTGRVLWEHRTLGEGWWTEFAEYAGGVLLLHGFATPDLPQHLKIFAVDAGTGIPLWSDLSVTFAGLTGETILALTPAGETVALDLKTGGRLTVRDAAAEPDAVDEHIRFPLPADLDGSEGFLKELLGGTGQAEILEVQGHLVVGYAAGSADGGTFAHEIAVVDPGRGKVVFRERILERTPGPAQETFFVLDDMLYYIRERRDLVAVRIPAARR